MSRKDKAFRAWQIAHHPTRRTQKKWFTRYERIEVIAHRKVCGAHDRWSFEATTLTEG